MKIAAGALALGAVWFFSRKSSAASGTSDANRPRFTPTANSGVNRNLLTPHVFWTPEGPAEEVPADYVAGGTPDIQKTGVVEDQASTTKDGAGIPPPPVYDEYIPTAPKSIKTGIEAPLFIDMSQSYSIPAVTAPLAEPMPVSPYKTSLELAGVDFYPPVAIEPIFKPVATSYTAPVITNIAGSAATVPVTYTAYVAPVKTSVTYTPMIFGR